MATFNKFRDFKHMMAEKQHNLSSDQLMIALTNTVPVVTNTILANISEISYTNVVSTPVDRIISVVSSGQTSGIYKLVVSDMIITATGGAIPTFRYLVIYNDTSTSDKLIGWYDYGTINIPEGESIVFGFNGSNGVLTLT